MKKYIVLAEFKGSVSGFDCQTFTTDQELTHGQLGDDLTSVALKEKWIKPVSDHSSEKEAVKPKPSAKAAAKKSS